MLSASVIVSQSIFMRMQNVYSFNLQQLHFIEKDGISRQSRGTLLLVPAYASPLTLNKWLMFADVICQIRHEARSYICIQIQTQQYRSISKYANTWHRGIIFRFHHCSNNGCTFQSLNSSKDDCANNA